MCPACVGKDLYSDQPGLSVCKKCRPGESGLTKNGTAEGAHVLCADITPPVIKLNGDAIIEVGQGLIYKDAHAVSDGNEPINSTVCDYFAISTSFVFVFTLFLMSRCRLTR